jgi:hypothetical protein
MSRRQCNFYNKPGGCNRGERCQFAHGHETPTQSGKSPSGAASSSGSRAPVTPRPDVPRGHCNFYWTKGDCNRGFNCRFAHVVNAAIASPNTAARAQPPAVDIAPFLTESGLAKLHGTASDGFFPPSTLSPSQTHGLLKGFLLDQYRFHDVTQIYAFLTALNNASGTNASWVSLFPV